MTSRGGGSDEPDNLFEEWGCDSYSNVDADDNAPGIALRDSFKTKREKEK